jgi:triphosphoribosyl-dephospho-CoA synthase
LAIFERPRPRFDQARLAEWIELACLIEATARKPGNVHPGASFEDLTYDDFVAAARIAAPILARAEELGVGQAVLEAVKATVAETRTNVNLGICLLIAPLAAAPRHERLRLGTKCILSALTVDDARLVYQAIRIANPGGLGDSSEQDVRDEPTQPLVEIMRIAAERDSIAAEYAGHFQLTTMASEFWPRKFSDDFRQQPRTIPEWEFLTIGMQLTLLKMNGDTLIRRKCGELESHEAACRADFLLSSRRFSGADGLAGLADFDAWLRADWHRRNPGTTADLIAAIWFAAIRDGLIVPPTKEEVLAYAARIRGAV